MIGRLRAAWDDSRRAANTRRGSNPMSREEWFELQDRIANLVTGESLSIHLTDYRRHIERCIESQFRLHEARTRSDEPLTRSDVEAIAVNAAGDLIGKAFLGSASPTAPDTNSRTVTGDLQTDDGDGVVREWNPETYEHTATRRTGIMFIGDGPLTRADAAALGAEIKEKLDDLLASKYARTRPDEVDDPDRAGRIIAKGFDEVFSKVAPTAGEPLDKFIAAQNAQAEKLAAEYQEFLALRRPPAAPASGATGCGSGAGCSAQVVLAGHVVDLTLEQNAVFGTLRVTVHLPGEPVWRTIVHPSLGNGDGNQVLPTHDLPVDKSLGGQGESEGTASVGTLEGAGGLLGHTPAHASAASLEERVSGSGVVHESEHGEGPAGSGHCGADGGEREEAHRVRPQCQGNDDVPVTVGPDVELVGIGNENGLEFGRGGDGPFGHSASPSIDGGHRTVGEGEVAGVETAAPVTDATDVFAGPGLFRYDGSQAHTAEPSQPTTTTTRQIAEVLEELHNQGNSWREIASKTRHIFTAPASPS